MIDCHPAVSGMVHAHPSETHCLEFSLQFRVHTESFRMLVVHQRSSDFSAVVMFPEVLAQTFECDFDAFDSGSDRQDDNFPLTCVFINGKDDFFSIF